MKDNPFWIIAVELYPTFLRLLFLYSVFVIAKSIWSKLGGNEDAISLAIQNIMEAFFWAHIAIPLVTAMYYFTMGIGETLKPVLKIIGGY